MSDEINNTKFSWNDIGDKPSILKSITHDFGDVKVPNNTITLGNVSSIIPAGATFVAILPRIIWPRATWDFKNAYVTISDTNTGDIYFITDNTQAYKLVVDFLYIE